MAQQDATEAYNAGNLVEFVESTKPAHGYAELSAAHTVRSEE